MRSLGGRLDRLTLVLSPGKPAGCVWRAGTCAQWRVVGDGSLDPVVPDLPATCPDCGRPLFLRTLIVRGVDVSRI